MSASDRFTELKHRVEKSESEIKEAASQDKADLSATTEHARKSADDRAAELRAKAQDTSDQAERGPEQLGPACPATHCQCRPLGRRRVGTRVESRSATRVPAVKCPRLSRLGRQTRQVGHSVSAMFGPNRRGADMTFLVRRGTPLHQAPTLQLIRTFVTAAWKQLRWIRPSRGPD